jgi:flagellar biosynthesis/type III secretory pathway protein FliH
MGRIVKARDEQESPSASVPTEQDSGRGREELLAEATLWLVRARASAAASRMEAKDLALVLARKMAEKIVGHAVALDPAVLSDIAVQALAASKAREGGIVLRVHPEDLATMEAARPTWREKIASRLEVTLVGDVSVGRHGCVVESDAGRVDARLETQLAALEQALRETGAFR